jgi:hypothetical protein
VKQIFVYTELALLTLLTLQCLYYRFVVTPVTNSMATGRKTKRWERAVQASGLCVQVTGVICALLIPAVFVAAIAIVVFKHLWAFHYMQSGRPKLRSGGLGWR